jgi:molecular chaperone DnaK (HSP70)
MPKIIGIDLERRTALLLSRKGVDPTVIPTAEGSRLLPSVVANKNNERLVGQTLRDRQLSTQKIRYIPLSDLWDDIMTKYNLSAKMSPSRLSKFPPVMSG